MSRLNSGNFIEKAKEIHGDKYLYDKIIYINSNKKVEIICPIHGSFWVRPNDHIYKKSGCSKCSYTKRGDALKERLCEENGFKLFRIKYNYTDEDFYNLCVEIQKIIDNGES